jgi:hypothetical protein
MKVNEITEGAWDFMMGALNPMSRKNMIGAQRGVDAAGDPVYNTAADYRASKKQSSTKDYEAQYRQQYLDQASAAEAGALTPDNVSSVTRKGINQTRREANMPPVDWAKLDAEHEAKQAAAAAPPPTRSATNQYGVMTAQATPAKYSKIPPTGGQATASWAGSGQQQPYTTSINNFNATPAPAPAKKAKPAPAPVPDDTASMSPEERRKYYNDQFKSGIKVAANRG